MTEAIYSILAAHVGVTTLVSTRMYPDFVPLKTDSTDTDYPCIMFQCISDVTVNSQSGVSAYHDARVQVNCYATTKDVSQHVRLAAKNALERKTPGSYGSVTVIAITLLNQDEEYFDKADFDGIYNHFLEFSVVHA